MRTRLWTTCLACVAVTALGAQQPPPAPNPPQPTFRAGTNYVRVDMYATDGGRPIDDLTPADIELREDGVVQKIEAFEHVRVRTATPEASRIEPNTIAESRQMAADPRARVFVIFLDTYNTTFEGSVKAEQPLMRFIDRVLGPDDLVAVMTPEMSAADLTFARKTAVISKMLQTTSDWGTRGRSVNMDDTEALYDRCFSPTVAAEMKARRREKLALDALDDLVTVLGGVREERKAVLTVSEGWMLYRESNTLGGSNPGALTPPEAPGVFGRVPRTRGDVQGGRAADAGVARCQSDLLALSRMDDTERLLQLTQRANRRNVTFYTIDSRGLVVFDSAIGGAASPPPPGRDEANLLKKQNSLRLIAEDTDGVAVVNTNQIDSAVDRIVADLSSYYLLGYYSTNPKLDGKFRTITVAVRRPHVQVRARRGYRALTANEVLVPPAPRGNGTESGTAARPLPGIVVDTHAPFLIRTSSWMAAGGGDAPAAAVWVVGELQQRKDPMWRRGAQADIAVVAPDGHTVISKTLDVAASDGTFALHVPDTGNVTPGTYTVRVRLTPQADAALPVSDIARVIVSDKPSAIGEPVMWRRGPTTGVRYVATADPRFTRAERIRLEFPAGATASASARLLDRNGHATAIPVQISDRTDAGGGIRWIVAEANLAPLAAGDYAIELTADGARQIVQFRVVP